MKKGASNKQPEAPVFPTESAAIEALRNWVHAQPPEDQAEFALKFSSLAARKHGSIPISPWSVVVFLDSGNLGATGQSIEEAIGAILMKVRKNP